MSPFKMGSTREGESVRDGIKTTRPDRVRLWINALLIALVIGISAWGCIQLTLSSGRVASIWLGNGILLAILLRSPSRNWTTYVLAGLFGNIAANLFSGDSLLISFGLALCNSFEVLVAAYPLRFLLGPNFSVVRSRGFAAFISFAVLLAPAATALMAGAFLGVTVDANFIETLAIWYPADALGMAIMAPLLLAVKKHEFLQLLTPGARLRSLGVLSVLLSVTLLVFAGEDPRLAFLVFVPLVIAVLQLGFAGGAAAILMMGGLALYFTIDGAGPFALVTGSHAREQVILLQGFIACALLIALPLSVIMEQSRRLTLDLERANRKLAEIATTDPLTGLPNRRLLDRTVMIEWRRAQRSGEPLSVVVLDVDNFKAYNDLYGHPAGDRCLKMLAETCNGCLRRPGDLFARYGGEEFIAVLPDTPAEGARHVAERMRVAVELAQIEHRLAPGNQVTISLGVATLADGLPKSSEELLEWGDKALYQAKRGGRNQVVSASQDILLPERSSSIEGAASSTG